VIVSNASRGGRELLWRRIKVCKSLDHICHTLELELPPSERPNVRRHDRLQVHLANPHIRDNGGRRLVTTVFVDEATVNATPSSLDVTVIGRSPARDIVDSTWSDQRWVNLDTDEPPTPHTLARIARDIAARFDIRFAWLPTGDPDPTDHVNFFAWQNETPWQKLITEADAQNFLFTSNEAGGLHLWRVAERVRSEGFRLTEGKNIRSMEWTENGAEQFHRDVVTGNFNGELNDRVEVLDWDCPPRGEGRTLTIDMTGFDVTREKLERRAWTERNRRNEARVKVEVSGWGLDDAQIREMGDTAGRYVFWGPNFLVPVRMPSLGLAENLLVAEVEHEADHETMLTTLTLTRRGAYA